MNVIIRLHYKYKKYGNQLHKIIAQYTSLLLVGKENKIRSNVTTSQKFGKVQSKGSTVKTWQFMKVKDCRISNDQTDTIWYSQVKIESIFEANIFYIVYKLISEQTSLLIRTDNNKNISEMQYNIVWIQLNNMQNLFG